MLVRPRRFVIAISQTGRRLLRALVALGLVAWLANRVGVRAIVDEFEMAHAGMVLFATLLLAVDGVAKACNWQQLLQRNTGNRWVPLSRVLSWFFAGGFIGAVVPSSASTDACRCVLAARALRGHAAACAASIVTLNALGWFTGSILGLLGMTYLYLSGQLPLVLGSVALVFLCTLTLLPTAYLLLAARREALMRFIARVGQRWPRLIHTLSKFVDALLAFEHAHRRFPAFLLIAGIGLVAQAGMFAVTARAVGIELPFAIWLVLVPLTRIVALIPVSIADFGLIQAAHVWVLSLFGVPPWTSFALSSLFAIEGLLIHSTLGAASFLAGGRANQADFRLDGSGFVG
ncbi:MAG TPA: lysylphosphatidylglycerol synthase transmembrane domain-containing protein [Steroidobacteraceae bacterium]|nr:lysylphosphatidylglycerol synthase transmembrane domain-containing protein [Steroidobacteraceae bacterium]